MSDAVLSFGTTLDLSGVKRGFTEAVQLAKTAGAGVASAWAGADDSLRKLSSGSDEAAASLKRIKDEADKAGDVGGEMERVFIGVADVMGVFGIEAEKNVRKAADMAGGIEGIVKGSASLLPLLLKTGPAIGVVTIALGAGAVAYTTYKEAVSDTEEETELLKSTSDRLSRTLEGLTDKGLSDARTSMEGLKGALKEAREENDLLNGSISLTDLAVTRGTDAVQEQARAAILSANQRVVALERTIEAEKELVGAQEAGSEAQEAHRVKLEAARQSLQKARTERERVNNTLGETIRLTGENIRESQAQADIKEAEARAEREAEKRRLEAEAALRKQQAAQGQLIALEQSATMASLEGEAAILYARDLQLAKIRELTQASGDKASGAAAAAAVEMQVQRELNDLWEANYQDLERQREKDLKATETALREKERLHETHLSGMVGRFASFAADRIKGERSLGESLKALTASLIADELQALARKYTIQAAAAFAAGNIPSGVLNLAGAAVAAGGAASLSAAASSVGGSGESTASTSTSSPSSSSSTTSSGLTAAGAEREQDQRDSSARTLTVVNQIGHRTFDAMTYDALNTDGSALAGVSDRSNTRGQRARG